MERRYYQAKAGGLTFRFAFDPENPEMLHVSARHGLTAQEVIDIWFEAQPHTTWNDDRKRYESFTKTYGVYWAKHVPTEQILIISCFISCFVREGI